MTIAYKLALSSLILCLIGACSGTDETNARILCAQNLSGAGYEACVENAEKF